mgnify:CR=1 FL=1
MTRWLWGVIGVLLIGAWNLQDRLTRLEHARVTEETLKRMVTQELVLPLLEQTGALQHEVARLAPLLRPIPEYPRGRKTRWGKRTAP